MMNQLQKEFAKCVKEYQKARKDLENCVKNALDRGLTRDEIFAVAERYHSGMPFCMAIILNEIFNYEENIRKKPLDIVEERESEQGDI